MSIINNIPSFPVGSGCIYNLDMVGDNSIISADSNINYQTYSKNLDQQAADLMDIFFKNDSIPDTYNNIRKYLENFYF